MPRQTAPIEGDLDGFGQPIGVQGFPLHRGGYHSAASIRDFAQSLTPTHRTGVTGVESIFIDEGFGSLDAEALRIALEALDGLQAQGRKVGVISHVQEMTERIGTQIRVDRMAKGRSRVVCES